MSDLVAFLTARYDEQERLARLVLEGTWQAPPFEIDPEWALREVEAGRKILDHWRDLYPIADSLIQEQREGVYAGDGEYTLGAYGTVTATLRALGAVYSDHPDYQKDWA